MSASVDPDRTEWDVIVVDCAPTGETLRLLSFPDAARWWLDKVFGRWLFRPFNRLFDRASRGYVRGARRVLRVSGIALVIYGGLLAFTFSFDDFITSFFVSGAGTTTLPLRIFSSLRFGVSPIINAAAVMILAVTLAAVVVAYAVLRRTAQGRRTAVPGL